MGLVTESLVEKFSNTVYQIAHNYTNNDEQSEAIYTAVFTRLFNLEDIPDDTEDYIIKITFDECNNQFKPKAENCNGSVEKALASLPHYYKQVLILKYGIEKDEADICRIIGDTYEHVELWIKSADELLYKKVGKHV